MIGKCRMFCTKCKNDDFLLNNETFNNHFPKPPPTPDREIVRIPWQQNSCRKTAAFISYIFFKLYIFQCSQRYFVLYFWNIKFLKYSILNSVFHEWITKQTYCVSRGLTKKICNPWCHQAIHHQLNYCEPKGLNFKIPYKNYQHWWFSTPPLIFQKQYLGGKSKLQKLNWTFKSF